MYVHVAKELFSIMQTSKEVLHIHRSNVKNVNYSKFVLSAHRSDVRRWCGRTRARAWRARAPPRPARSLSAPHAPQAPHHMTTRRAKRLIPQLTNKKSTRQIISAINDSSSVAMC